MKVLFFLVLTLAAAGILSVEGAVRLPALVGNNMVLQQNTTINVWGWADAGEKVTIKASWLNEAVSTTTTDAGDWKTNLKTPAAGGPYTMEIAGRDYSITIENIMIGEVWVCSGQSNMEYTLRGLGGWKNYKPDIRDEVDKGTYANVRLFTVQRDTSAFPLSTCKGNWLIPDTNTVNDFSATAWFYGAYLNRQLGVPVGMISAAWGGSPAEVWTPVENIKAEPDLGYYLTNYNGSSWWPGTAGVLYNAMIHPLINYTIKGAIWYQGESNKMDANLYPQLMKTLITSWRNAWRLSDFPFYYVQIAPFAYNEPTSGALLREAQMKCLSIPNTGMAVTLDLVDNINDIHPKNKFDVGKRLALCALNKTYSMKEVVFSGPLYKEMETKGNKIILRFLYTNGGLSLNNAHENNFRIAGSDRIFHPAKVTVEENQLVVSSPKVKKPIAVRYAFTNTSEATLFNGAGLPASSFRTDDWDIITTNAILKPFIEPSTQTLAYTLTSHARESDIYYDFGKLPNKNSPLFQSPIPSGKNAVLYATISRNGYLSENSCEWKLVANKAIGAGINYKYPFSKKYASNGDITLIDGILATNDFKDGCWLGFQKEDMEITIDLRKKVHSEKISINFLSDNPAHIFLPKKVTVTVSENGVTYKAIGESDFSNDKALNGTPIQTVSFDVKSKIQFIKITAINQGVCPLWHPGAGQPCWLFADEIILH